MQADYFLGVFIRLFFLLTPFFVLTVFLAMTRDEPKSTQHRVAIKTTLAVVILGLALYFFGNAIFSVLGITLDAFRIGAGALLFLSAVGLVRGRDPSGFAQQEGDFSVVPLAIPITLGPATIGALLVMGAASADPWRKALGAAALLAAALATGLVLYAGPWIERVLGRQGIDILSKITGLVLAALAAQITFTGVKNFLG
jgi:multiple antibiotic resistance protein